MYKNILLTVDGSELAEQALPHAVTLTACFKADLHLIRVVIPFGMLVPTNIEYDITENYRHSMLHDAHVYLTTMEKRLQPELGSRIHTQVIEGVVVDSILEYADFHAVDLIVMATHGRSGLGRWVFGSVAERVLHAAKVPVFLVHARKVEAVTTDNQVQEKLTN